MAYRLFQILICRPVRTAMIWGVVLTLSLCPNVDFRPVPGVRGLLPDGVEPETDIVGRLKDTFLEADRILVVLEGRESIPISTARNPSRLIDGMRISRRASRGPDVPAGGNPFHD